MSLHQRYRSPAPDRPGLDQRLAEIERQCQCLLSITRYADRNVFDLRQRADSGMQCPSRRRWTPAASTPRHGRSCQWNSVGSSIAPITTCLRGRIDPARAFVCTRRGYDVTSLRRGWRRPNTATGLQSRVVSVRHVKIFRQQPMRPYRRVPLAITKQDDSAAPSTEHPACRAGAVSAVAPLALMPPSRMATGMTASWVIPRQEGY